MKRNKTTQPLKHDTQASPNLADMYKKPGVILLSFGIVLIGAIFALNFLIPKGERINHSGYQVVYMTSGQAYFGKLKNTTGEYLVLNTPYTVEDVQNNDKNQTGSSTALLKVSKQQYGPEDVMSLKSEHVLFWQNLRTDSKVVQAIQGSK
jgi:hypothetical protein